MGAPEPGRAGKRVALLRASFPDRPALGTAVSRAILLRAAAGELPPTIRVARPGPVLAFGRQDAASRGYLEAVRAAREAGFEPVERLAGGGTQKDRPRDGGPQRGALGKGSSQ